MWQRPGAVLLWWEAFYTRWAGVRRTKIAAQFKPSTRSSQRLPSLTMDKRVLRRAYASAGPN